MKWVEREGTEPVLLRLELPMLEGNTEPVLLRLELLPGGNTNLVLLRLEVALLGDATFLALLRLEVGLLGDATMEQRALCFPCKWLLRRCSNSSSISPSCSKGFACMSDNISAKRSLGLSLV